MTLALNKELAKRAVVLLRASSKQQTDREHDFDIPQQKSILLPFVESKGWDLVKVFTEGGVSGFKVSANDRDAIQDIKKMAEDCKVAVRNARRDGIDQAKKEQKDGEMTEDELKQAENKIQELTDKSIEEIDKILANKENEILSI